MEILYENRQYNIYFQVNHNQHLSWPLHQHHWAELVYTQKGITRMQYLSNGKLETVDLSPGQLLFFFPYVPHQYLAEPSSGAEEFYTITFNPSINRQFQNLCMTHHLENPCLDVSLLHQDVRYLLLRFFQKDITAQPLSVLEAYLTIFLEQLYPSLSLTKIPDTARKKTDSRFTPPHTECRGCQHRQIHPCAFQRKSYA